MSFEPLNQELFMSKFQYQSSTKWWYHRWLGLNLLKPRSFLGIIATVSQTKFHHIRITKSSYSRWDSSTKMGKNEKVEKIFWITKRGHKEITNQGSFCGLQIMEEGWQIGAALGISNWGKKITNWGRDLKSGQRLQIRARGISNRGRDDKSKQNTFSLCTTFSLLYHLL